MTIEESSLALSAQQRKLREASMSALTSYRSVVLGEESWVRFISFELYVLALSGVGGALGLFLRQKLLPTFLKCSGLKPIIGRWITIRQPGRISLGDHVFLDDSVVLDLRVTRNNASAINIGDSVVVGRNSLLIAKDGEIILEKGVNISSQCRIATQSKIVIGESTLIAAYCYIGPGNHTPASDGKALIESEMEILGGVTIGKNVWIGAHSTILDGVSVGEGAIIGAHSLVRESVPPRTVVAGVPAKVIRELPAEVPVDKI